MNRSLRMFVLAVVATQVSWASAVAATVDLEDLSLPGANSYNNGFPNGNWGSLTPPAIINSPFVSRGASFSNQFELTDYGSPEFPFIVSSWSGFSYSNRTDTVTAGFGNQYSAITGSGYNSPNYAVGFDNMGFGVASTITLPTAEYPVSMRVTNTTYAYQAVVNGDDGGFNGVRQFGANSAGTHVNEGFPDLLKLTVTGYDAANVVTGTIDVAMADYTFADNADDYALSDWLEVDLTALGTNTRMLQFSMTTTDNDPIFGANTPLYFALDDLVTALDISELPEPGAWASGLIVAAAALAYGIRRVRSHRRPVCRHL